MYALFWNILHISEQVLDNEPALYSEENNTVLAILLLNSYITKFQ